MWIALAIFAAFVQNLRFMLQKHLADSGFSAAGASYARYIFSAPVLLLLIWVMYYPAGLTPPAFPTTFWIYVTLGAVTQLGATLCMIALFTYRNFAIGTVFKRTEVLLSALIGTLIVGEYLPVLSWVLLFIGFVGVLLLSQKPLGNGGVNRSLFYGLGAGFLFGLCAVAYRIASLSLQTDHFVLNALNTLCVAVWIQFLVLSGYLILYAPAQLWAVIRAWRISALVSLNSLFGSAALFMALTLQNAAYVNAIIQVELVFAAIGSYFYFSERLNRREWIGAVLIVSSVVALIITAL